MTAKQLIYCFLILTLASIIVMVMPEISFSQPAPPAESPEQAPVDGGLALLAAAGGTYAVKKLRNKE